MDDYMHAAEQLLEAAGGGGEGRAGKSGGPSGRREGASGGGGGGGPSGGPGDGRRTIFVSTEDPTAVERARRWGDPAFRRRAAPWTVGATPRDRQRQSRVAASSFSKSRLRLMIPHA